MARVRSIKVQYLLHLEDLIHLLLVTKLSYKVAKEAKTSGGEYRIYPSRSEDPKKNPLDAGTKVKYMRMAYPDHANAIVDNPDMRTIFDVLTALDSDGYSSVNIVVGGDRVSEFNSLTQNTTETYTHSTKSMW